VLLTQKPPALLAGFTKEISQTDKKEHVGIEANGTSIPMTDQTATWHGVSKLIVSLETPCHVAAAEGPFAAMEFMAELKSGLFVKLEEANREAGLLCSEV